MIVYTEASLDGTIWFPIDDKPNVSFPYKRGTHVSQVFNNPGVYGPGIAQTNETLPSGTNSIVTVGTTWPVQISDMPNIYYPWQTTISSYVPMPENKNIDVELLTDYVSQFFKDPVAVIPAPAKLEVAPELSVPSVKDISKRILKIKEGSHDTENS